MKFPDKYTEDQINEFWSKADDSRGEKSHLRNDVFDLVQALKDAYEECDYYKKQLNRLQRHI